MPTEGDPTEMEVNIDDGFEVVHILLPKED